MLQVNHLKVVSWTPTSDNAENLSQYDLAVERDVKPPTLTLKRPYITQNVRREHSGVAGKPLEIHLS